MAAFIREHVSYFVRYVIDQEIARKLAQWAVAGHPQKPQKFFDNNDYKLVITAAQEGRVMVTSEIRSKSLANGWVAEIKIPNACEAIGVKSIDLMEFVRRERLSITVTRNHARGTAPT